MTRLAILRHGHTDWNRAGRIQGRTDIPLDEAAREQLAPLSLPAPWNHANLVSSPLSRAVETAELVTGRTPVEVPALIEMDWGRWEGQRGLELRADPASGFRDIEEWGWGYTPPGGESPGDLRMRLEPWANGLRADTVAVCHIGVMRVVMAIAMGWDFVGTAPFQIKRNRLYILDISANGWQAAPDPVRLVQKSR